YDTSSDSFSLGVILWELLTGRPLFGAATAAQTLESLHRAPIPRVQRHHFVRGEPIAFALAQVVAQALSRKPAQRLSTYDAFATPLGQRGELATPDVVSERVKRALTHDSIEQRKARSARTPVDAAPITKSHARDELDALPPMAAASAGPRVPPA